MTVALRFTNRGECREDCMEKETQPGTLSTAGPSDAVEAIVPVAAPDQREPVRPDRQTFFDGADAVFEHRSFKLGHVWLQIALLRVARQRWGFDEWHRPVEKVEISCMFDVVCGDEGQPQQIVRAARAQAASSWLMPPVEDVTLDELARSRAKQVISQEIGPRHRQRHDVLQLIA